MLELRRFIFMSNGSMKKRYIFLSWIIIFGISIIVCPKGIDNSISLLLENNYFIPQESSICVFRDTMAAEGSGEGWLYGEDDKYYYGMNTDYESECDPSYYILEKGLESPNFDKFDFKTWDKRQGVGWLPKKFGRDGYAKKCGKWQNK